MDDDSGSGSSIDICGFELGSEANMQLHQPSPDSSAHALHAAGIPPGPLAALHPSFSYTHAFRDSHTPGLPAAAKHIGPRNFAGPPTHCPAAFPRDYGGAAGPFPAGTMFHHPVYPPGPGTAAIHAAQLNAAFPAEFSCFGAAEMGLHMGELYPAGCAYPELEAEPPPPGTEEPTPLRTEEPPQPGTEEPQQSMTSEFYPGGSTVLASAGQNALASTAEQAAVMQQAHASLEIDAPEDASMLHTLLHHCPDLDMEMFVAQGVALAHHTMANSPSPQNPAQPDLTAPGAVPPLADGAQAGAPDEAASQQHAPAAVPAAFGAADEPTATCSGPDPRTGMPCSMQAEQQCPEETVFSLLHLPLVETHPERRAFSDEVTHFAMEPLALAGSAVCLVPTAAHPAASEVAISSCSGLREDAPSTTLNRSFSQSPSQQGPVTSRVVQQIQDMQVGEPAGAPQQPDQARVVQLPASTAGPAFEVPSSILQPLTAAVQAAASRADAASAQTQQQAVGEPLAAESLPEHAAEPEELAVTSALEHSGQPQATGKRNNSRKQRRDPTARRHRRKEPLGPDTACAQPYVRDLGAQQSRPSSGADEAVAAVAQSHSPIADEPWGVAQPCSDGADQTLSVAHFSDGQPQEQENLAAQPPRPSTGADEASAAVVQSHSTIADEPRGVAQPCNDGADQPLTMAHFSDGQPQEQRADGDQPSSTAKQRSEGVPRSNSHMSDRQQGVHVALPSTSHELRGSPAAAGGELTASLDKPQSPAPPQDGRRWQRGKRMIGKRIRVWWPEERQYFSGTIRGYAKSTRQHFIKYDDDDQEMIYLNDEKWHYCDPADKPQATQQAAAKTPRPARRADRPVPALLAAHVGHDLLAAGFSPEAPPRAYNDPRNSLDVPPALDVLSSPPCTEPAHAAMGSLAHGRVKRIPGGDPLKDVSTRRLIDMIRGDSTEFEADGRVLRLKQYIRADANAPTMDAIIDALAVNVRVEALYIQNFELGMHDEQLERLTEVLKLKRIWAVNVGENFQISLTAWERFCQVLPQTAVGYMYVSEHHLLRTDLKERMIVAIRQNRKIAPARHPDVIVRIGNMWWNPKLPTECAKAAAEAAAVAAAGGQQGGLVSAFQARLSPVNQPSSRHLAALPSRPQAAASAAGSPPKPKSRSGKRRHERGLADTAGAARSGSLIHRHQQAQQGQRGSVLRPKSRSGGSWKRKHDGAPASRANHTFVLSSPATEHAGVKVSRPGQQAGSAPHGEGSTGAAREALCKAAKAATLVGNTWKPKRHDRRWKSWKLAQDAAAAKAAAVQHSTAQHSKSRSQQPAPKRPAQANAAPHQQTQDPQEQVRGHRQRPGGSKRRAAPQRLPGAHVERASTVHNDSAAAAGPSGAELPGGQMSSSAMHRRRAAAVADAPAGTSHVAASGDSAPDHAHQPQKRRRLNTSQRERAAPHQEVQAGKEVAAGRASARKSLRKVAGNSRYNPDEWENDLKFNSPRKFGASHASPKPAAKRLTKRQRFMVDDSKRILPAALDQTEHVLPGAVYPLAGSLASGPGGRDTGIAVPAALPRKRPAAAPPAAAPAAKIGAAGRARHVATSQPLLPHDAAPAAGPSAARLHGEGHGQPGATAHPRGAAQHDTAADQSDAGQQPDILAAAAQPAAEQVSGGLPAHQGGRHAKRAKRSGSGQALGALRPAEGRQSGGAAPGTAAPPAGAPPAGAGAGPPTGEASASVASLVHARMSALGRVQVLVARPTGQTYTLDVPAADLLSIPPLRANGSAPATSSAMAGGGDRPAKRKSGSSGKGVTKAAKQSSAKPRARPRSDSRRRQPPAQAPDGSTSRKAPAHAQNAGSSASQLLKVSTQGSSAKRKQPAKPAAARGAQGAFAEQAKALDGRRGRIIGSADVTAGSAALPDDARGQADSRRSRTQSAAGSAPSPAIPGAIHGGPLDSRLSRLRPDAAGSASPAIPDGAKPPSATRDAKFVDLVEAGIFPTGRAEVHVGSKQAATAYTVDVASDGSVTCDGVGYETMTQFAKTILSQPRASCWSYVHWQGEPLRQLRKQWRPCPRLAA